MMMKYLLFLVWASILPTDITTTATAEPHPLEDLLWLEGSWHDSKLGITETWKMTGDSLSGRSYMQKEGQEQDMEKMWLVRRGNGIWYIVQPAGQAELVEFEFQPLKNGKYVFINLKNDYPQKIVYEKQGKDVIATISLADGSEPFSFNYQKK